MNPEICIFLEITNNPDCIVTIIRQIYIESFTNNNIIIEIRLLYAV